MVRFNRNKYHNYPTIVDNIRFASKKESERYKILCIAQKQGEISELKLQPRYELQSSFKKNDNKYRAINYIADFSYIENEKQVVEDCKGFKKDKVFLLKQKLFEYKYPNLEIKII